MSPLRSTLNLHHLRSRSAVVANRDFFLDHAHMSATHNYTLASGQTFLTGDLLWR
jgi:hypothetical protein